MSGHASTVPVAHELARSSIPPQDDAYGREVADGLLTPTHAAAFLQISDEQLAELQRGPDRVPFLLVAGEPRFRRRPWLATEPEQ